MPLPASATELLPWEVGAGTKRLLSDAAIEHFCNISHLIEPIMATASVTGEKLGTPNAKMKAQLGKGEPKLFTPWMALQDQELAQED